MSVLKNLIYSDNISHITNMLSQIETAHNMSLAHKLMEIENNPVISAIQETLGRYEDILKPLHMQEVSAVERAMRDIRPSADSRMPSAFLLRDARHAMHDIFFCASLQSCRRLYQMGD